MVDFKNKKLSVLHQLSQELEPVSLPDLIEKLGEDFAERSVRRWLTEMVTEGLVKKIGHKRGTKYCEIHKAIRFDVVRVRYRQQRRALVRDIILNHLIGKPMMDRISVEVNLVNEQDQDSFHEDVLEDLREIDQSYIVALNITREQLNEWLAIKKRIGSKLEP